MTQSIHDLTLSGGGFRATIFHVGVVAALREMQQLQGIRTVCSVSGGSITAAHMALRWSDYTGSDESFDAAVEELLNGN